MTELGTLISKDELKKTFVAACDAAGSAEAFARKKGVSASLVRMTLAGNRPIGSAIANALGYVHCDRYVRVK